MSEEESFVIGRFRFDDGCVLENVPVGFRRWGALNTGASNAILVCHGFPANSDAMDWWPWLIGPGKVLDTDRFCVICVSSFSNLNASAAIKSCGPTSRDPATGAAYGAAFPRLTMVDLVRGQDAVLQHLGVSRLALAIGPSMGAAQVLTRACRRPQTVASVVAVLPYCGEDILAELSIRAWSAGLTEEGEIAELTDAFYKLALDAVGCDAVNAQFGSTQDAAAALREISKTRAMSSDRRHFSTLCDALASARVEAPDPNSDLPQILLAPASSDRLFPPSVANRLAAKLASYGFATGQVLLESDRGHLAGLSDHVSRLSPEIEAAIRI